MYSRHVNAEGIAALEGFGTEVARIEEEAGEMNGLQVVAHFGRDLGLKLAQCAAGHP